jgi:hypothetical protein
MRCQLQRNCRYVKTVIALTLGLLVGARASAQSVTPPTWLDGPAMPPHAPSGAVVTLRLEIGEDGDVRAAELVTVDAEPEAHERLASFALAAIRLARFEPARREGRATAARVELALRFPPPPDAHDAPGVLEARASDSGTTSTYDVHDANGSASTNAASANAASADAASASANAASANAASASANAASARNATTDADAVRPDDDIAEGPFGAEAVVDAERRAREAASASDQVVEVGQLRHVPRREAQSFLTLTPGVLLTQHANEGHAMSMFLRGFDAAEGEDLELRVDGVPLNEVSNAHGHGYADLTFVIPRAIREVRTVQGPFDPAQGDFAIAGSSELTLGFAPDDRGVHLSLGYGAFGQTRVVAAYAPQDEADGTFGAVAFNRGDGFGPNRALRNASTLLRYEHALDASTRVHVLGFGAVASWRSAGVVRADDVRLRRLDRCGSSRDEQFFCFYDPNQGGSSARGGVVVGMTRERVNRRFSLQLGGQRRNLRVQENYTGFVSDPRTDGGPQRGDNLDLRYDTTSLFARGSFGVRTVALGRRQDLELGFVLRHDAADTVGDRRRAELAVPYRTDFDRAVRQTHVGAHVRADLRPTAWLSFLGGARIDFFGFDVLDRNFAETDRIGERLPRSAFTAHGIALSPRGSVSVRLHESLVWITAVGLGARSSDAAALSEAELAPFARVTALESGFVLDHTRDDLTLEARLSAFTTHVSQDLVFDPNAGRNTTLGPSARTGALVQARVRVGTWLDAMGSATYTRGHLQPRGVSRFALFEGDRLPFVPAWLVRVDAALQHALRLRDEAFTGRLALGTSYVGRRPLPFAETADPYALVDVSVGVGWRTLELSLAIENLLDARYRSAELHYASSFRDPELPPSRTPARHFSAGAPRTWLLTISGRLGL